jgi:CRISPR/Cas system CMR-associated protein Cmr3 (group 5 of RAMP superfamily)
MVKEHWADSIIPPLFIWLFMMFDSRYIETQKIRLDAIVFSHPITPVDLRNTFYHSNDSWVIKDFGK